MADSPPNDHAARRSGQGDAVKKLFRSIDDCDVFREALNAYQDAGEDIRSARDAHSPLRAAAEVLDGAVSALVTAAADYYLAHSLYDILAALETGEESADDE
jgi:hypothetical protein